MNKCCQLLAKKKLKVTFIESASAGYLAYRFSLNKNSGDILNGSLVCYDANLKVSILKISKKFLEKYSPESAEVTEQLVLNAKQIIDSDIFVGCTGLLKRGGSETKEKPVGTFFYCISYQNKLHHYRCIFNGTKKKKLEQLSRAISQSIIEVVKQK
ncbi:MULTISPECIES: CinA family protein [Acinetobacter]|uniref:CinA family protein n=1 Tax=Acinetobacter TaxID=469 RepID=UPI0002D130F4|nr:MULTISPECIES: CinA family protein [Acinetobacter]ENW88899.1 hypothetical protein F905_01896 [Acinetobacter sp. CIP 53.82]MBA0156049.1 CinA family protein [Acinetobacter indicus]